MNRLMIVSLCVLLCVLCKGELANAQALAAPSNLRVNSFSCYWSGILYGKGANWIKASYPIHIDVRFDSVRGATAYRIDVAEDSLFRTMLPGLKSYQDRQPFNNYPYVFAPQLEAYPEPGRVLTRIFGFLPGKKPYYLRVRATNGSSESLSSTVASVTTGCQPYKYGGGGDCNNYCFGARIVRLTDTSVTFNIWDPDRSILGIFLTNDKNEEKFLMTATNGIVHIGGLSPEKTYSVSYYGVFKTLPSLLSPYTKVISFYEGPEEPAAQDEPRYYHRSFPIATDMREVFSQFATLHAKSISWDTAWYNSGGFISCFGREPNPCDDYQDSVKATFIVRTTAPNTQMVQLGYTQGYPRPSAKEYYTVAWRYSNDATYYRFVYDPLVSVQEPPTPEILRLYQNAPNPFSETTTLRYELPQQSHVRLELYDMLGQRVSELTNATQTAGSHTLPISGISLPSGIYVVRLHTTDALGANTTKTMTISVLR